MQRRNCCRHENMQLTVMRRNRAAIIYAAGNINKIYTQYKINYCNECIFL